MEVSYEAVDSGVKTTFAAKLSDGRYDVTVPAHINLEDITNHSIGYIELRDGHFYFSPNAEIVERYQLWGRFFRRNNRKYVKPDTNRIFLYNMEGRPIGSIKIKN
ncbi:MAG TPA: hypothetical protein VJJ52_02730 [Candidatus Nanoarchaeia archaeon]|nr:hypothetical protein [Candidatus Nanoarchaeia archaeon]